MDYRINLNPSRNMSIHDLAVIKHPFLANLRRSSGVNVEVKIKREEQAFEVHNYDGDINRLKTMLSKAKGDTDVCINPKFIDITDEETPEEPPKTDENLKYEIEVLETEQEVLEQMLSGTEIQLEEAKKQVDWFTSQYASVEAAKAKLSELCDLRLAKVEFEALKKENVATLEELLVVKKTNEGLQNNYSRKVKQVKELQLQLDEQTALIAELGEKKLDCKEASISFVKQCSNDLKTFERKLAEIVGEEDINDLLKLNGLEMIKYISIKTVHPYSLEDITELLNSKPEQFSETSFYAENKAKYDEAKNSINFLDSIVKSNMQLPELLRSSFAKLKINEENYKKIMAEFEEKEKLHKEQTSAHDNVRAARDYFNKAQKLKELRDNAPAFRMCTYSDENTGNTTIYLPYGMEDGYVMQSSIMARYAKCAKIDDSKSMMEITIPKEEHTDIKKFVADIRKTLEHIIPNIVCEEIKVY